jgi:hypothetical protein
MVEEGACANLAVCTNGMPNVVKREDDLLGFIRTRNMTLEGRTHDAVLGLKANQDASEIAASLRGD